MVEIIEAVVMVEIAVIAETIAKEERVEMAVKEEILKRINKNILTLYHQARKK